MHDSMCGLCLLDVRRIPHRPLGGCDVSRCCQCPTGDKIISRWNLCLDCHAMINMATYNNEGDLSRVGVTFVTGLKQFIRDKMEQYCDRC